MYVRTAVHAVLRWRHKYDGAAFKAARAYLRHDATLGPRGSTDGPQRMKEMTKNKKKMMLKRSNARQKSSFFLSASPRRDGKKKTKEGKEEAKATLVQLNLDVFLGHTSTNSCGCARAPPSAGPGERARVRVCGGRAPGGRN